MQAIAEQSTQPRPYLRRLGFAVAIAAACAAVAIPPTFAQGVYQSPPSPNSAQSMPQPLNSAPLGVRTLSPGSTGTEQMGTVGTTQVQPEAAQSR